MGWKQAAGFLTVVFVIVLLQTVLAGPMVTLQNDLNESGDYSNEHFDGNSFITDMFEDWFNVGLVAVFLLMGALVAEAVRRELTRNRRP